MTANSSIDRAQLEGVRADAGSPEQPDSVPITSTAVLFLSSITLFAVVMALGPSAAVPQIGHGGPIWSLSARPSSSIVFALEGTALILGALAVASGIAAIGRGWRPSAKLLVFAGAVVTALFVFLPPAGSTDVLNYAIYGRIAALGHNPYIMTPAQLHSSGDPVGVFAPLAWRTWPTVYGPVATALQWVAAELGGASMARIVFWIRLSNGIAFIATAVGLVRLAGRDRARQARACLLWAVNPLMLFWLVGSGHVDVWLALLAVFALMVIHSRHRSGIVQGVVTGVIIGAGIAIKTPFALAGMGMAWAASKSPRIIVAGLLGASAVLIPGYLLPGVLDTAVVNQRLTFDDKYIFPVPAAVASRPTIFMVLVLSGVLAMALLLFWRMPAGPPALPGVRPATVLVLAFLVCFPTPFPWYDALFFPLLALMSASRLDNLLIARCLMLSLMCFPASTAAEHLVYHLSHLGVLLLLAALIVMYLVGAPDTTSRDDGEAGAMAAREHPVGFASLTALKREYRRLGFTAAQRRRTERPDPRGRTVSHGRHRA
jgi:hypothetical protein